MTTRPNLNGLIRKSAISFTEMPCGQTKTPNWTNYPRNFASADDLSI